MKYQVETVIGRADSSFRTEHVVGAVVDNVSHVHPELEITYVESSVGVRSIGNNVSEFQPDDLVLIGSMLPHHYVSNSNEDTSETRSRFKVINFKETFAGEQLFDIPEFSEIKRLMDTAKYGVVFEKEFAKRVYPLVCRVFDSDGAYRVLRLLELLAQMASSDYRQLATDLPRSTSCVPDERMERVLSFVKDQLKKNVDFSLADVAKVACMTPPSFSRYFKKATRRRFMDYVTALKVQRACKLLAHTELSVLDISGRSGYNNLSNFNRHFSRIKGVSPREYRKRVLVGQVS